MHTKNEGSGPKPQGRPKAENAMQRRTGLGFEVGWKEDCGVAEERGRRRRHEIKVGTWNVRTMNTAGKLENVKEEMKRMGLNILGISEVRWKEEGHFINDGYRVCMLVERCFKRVWPS